MENGLVSIIVPVYNAEDYLHQCIDSILGQTYRNIEVILVDDGSTDNSGDICREYANVDSRIIVLSQKNAGAAAARNKGIDIARGEYIGFVDSDDYIDSDMYEILVDAIQENNADVAQILSRRVTNDGAVVNQELIDRTENNPPVIYHSEGAIEHYLTGNHSLWCHIYMATLFNNLYIPEGMSGEDLAVVIPLYDRCNRVVKVNKYKYNYRLNLNSVTHSGLTQRAINLFYEYEKQLHKYSNRHVYKEILIFTLSKSLAGILNAMLLEGDDGFDNNETYFKNKLKKYYSLFCNNKYISKNQINKYNLYLKIRPLYKMMLILKRRFLFRKPLYGEE